MVLCDQLSGIANFRRSGEVSKVERCSVEYSSSDAMAENLDDGLLVVVERVPDYPSIRPEPDFSRSGRYPTLPKPDFF